MMVIGMMPIFLVYNKETGKMCDPETLVAMLKGQRQCGFTCGDVGMSYQDVCEPTYEHLEFYQHTRYDDADGNMVFEGHVLDVSSFGWVCADDVYVVTSVNSFANYRGYDNDGWEDHAGDIRIVGHVTGCENTLHKWEHCRM